jgi:predicted glycosyltransferase
VKRLLMYSQDGMGLGHLRRSSNIAHEVLDNHEDCDVLILADSPATRIFAPRRGLDVVKLPTIIKAGSATWRFTNWRTGSLSSDIRRVIKLRAKLILQTFREFRPDTVLVDHMPVGAVGELKPSFDRALNRPSPPRLFLGLRDILDTPSVIRRAWRELGAYDYLPYYESVLVYGRRDIHDATSAYRLLPHARRIVYCNYVSPHSQHALLDHPPEEPFILVTGGGGADAFPLASTFLKALPMLHPELRMRGVVLTGPNMQPGDREALLARATPSVHIESGFDKAEEWIQKATLVITMGGYNSLCEILKWQKKALVVPRAGPSTEQRTRSLLFAERGLVRMLDSAELNPGRLADELVRLLEDETVPNPANAPLLDGAQRAARLLMQEPSVEEAVAEELLPDGQEGVYPAAPVAPQPPTPRGGGTNPVEIW